MFLINFYLCSSSQCTYFRVKTLEARRKPYRMGKSSAKHNHIVAGHKCESRLIVRYASHNRPESQAGTRLNKRKWQHHLRSGTSHILAFSKMCRASEDEEGDNPEEARFTNTSHRVLGGTIQFQECCQNTCSSFQLLNTVAMLRTDLYPHFIPVVKFAPTFIYKTKPSFYLLIHSLFYKARFSNILRAFTGPALFIK